MLYSLPQEELDTSCLMPLLNRPQLTTVVSSLRADFSQYLYIVKVACSPLQIITQIPFKHGDKAYFIPTGYELDLTLLPMLGCWDNINNCGSLKGPKKNVTHISAIKRQLSYGMLLKYDENNPLDLDKLTKPYVPAIGEDFLSYRPEVLSNKFNAYLPIRKEVAPRDEYVVLEKAPGISLYFYQLNGSFNVMNFGKSKSIIISNPYLAAQGLVYKNMRAGDSLLLSLFTKYNIEKLFDLIKSIKAVTSIFVHATALFPNNLYSSFSTGTMVINKIIVDGRSLPLKQEFCVCDAVKVKHIPVLVDKSIVTPGNSKIFMNRNACLMKPVESCDQATIKCAGLYLRNIDKPKEDIIIDNPSCIASKKGVDLL